MKENESSVAVTEARHNLDSLLAGARLGRLTHIVKGSEILAHLVPPAARIIDQDGLLNAMATALLRGEAERIAHEGSVAAIDTGHLFVWAWHTDVQLFQSLLSEFTDLLSAAAGRPYVATDVFGLLRGAMSDAGLS